MQCIRSVLYYFAELATAVNLNMIWRRLNSVVKLVLENYPFSKINISNSELPT